MEQALKNRLRRMPLFFMGISIVFYAISFLYLGYMPKNDQAIYFDGKILFNLPYNIPQLWNPLLVFVLVFLIIALSEIDKKLEIDRKNEVNDPKNILVKITLSILCILTIDLIIAYLFKGSFLSDIFVILSFAIIFMYACVMIVSICILINKKIKNTGLKINRLKRLVNWLAGQ